MGIISGSDIITLKVGDIIELWVPIVSSPESQELIEARGYFPAQKYGGEDLLNGFRVENEEVGSIVKLTTKVGIKYTHLKPAENKIYFHARTGQIGLVNITNIPIHSHQSVYEGGPAYGTYYRDLTDNQD